MCTCMIHTQPCATVFPCFYTINDRDMTLLIQQVLSSEARRSAQAGGEGSEAQPNNHGVPALFEGSGSMERQYCMTLYCIKALGTV